LYRIVLWIKEFLMPKGNDEHPRMKARREKVDTTPGGRKKRVRAQIKESRKKLKALRKEARERAKRVRRELRQQRRMKR
jgi:hypothetical protein